MKSMLRVVVVGCLPVLALAAALWANPGMTGALAGGIPAEVAGQTVPGAGSSTADAHSKVTDSNTTDEGVSTVNRDLPFAPLALVYPAVGTAGIGGAFLIRRRRSEANQAED